eukprot:126195-Chlamydomonas_euryale.AAC.8
MALVGTHNVTEGSQLLAPDSQHPRAAKTGRLASATSSCDAVVLALWAQSRADWMASARSHRPIAPVHSGEGNVPCPQDLTSCQGMPRANAQLTRPAECHPGTRARPQATAGRRAGTACGRGLQCKSAHDERGPGTAEAVTATPTQVAFSAARGARPCIERVEGWERGAPRHAGGGKEGCRHMFEIKAGWMGPPRMVARQMCTSPAAHAVSQGARRRGRIAVQAAHCSHCQNGCSSAWRGRAAFMRRLVPPLQGADGEALTIPLVQVRGTAFAAGPAAGGLGRHRDLAAAGAHSALVDESLRGARRRSSGSGRSKAETPAWGTERRDASRGAATTMRGRQSTRALRCALRISGAFQLCVPSAAS